MIYNKEKFKGIFSALLTPFKSNSSLDKEGVKRLVEFNIKNGIDGFYVGGSTGEGFLLTNEERKELFRYAAEANAGRKTMIAHVGSISTGSAVDMAEMAEQLGYDAVSAVAPFYYKFPLEAILKYYRDIAVSTSLPVIIFNFPASSGFTLTKEIANELFENNKFIGIKHTSSDLYELQQFKTIKRDILVYNGFDEMLLAGLSMGADGAIGSTYNFMGNRFKKLFECFRAGKIDEAQKIQKDANDIISILAKYGVFQCEKAILKEMDVDVGICRAPFLPLSKEGEEAVKEIVSKLKTNK